MGKLATGRGQLYKFRKFCFANFSAAVAAAADGSGCCSPNELQLVVAFVVVACCAFKVFVACHAGNHFNNFLPRLLFL